MYLLCNCLNLFDLITSNIILIFDKYLLILIPYLPNNAIKDLIGFSNIL